MGKRDESTEVLDRQVDYPLYKPRRKLAAFAVLSFVGALGAGGYGWFLYQNLQRADARVAALNKEKRSLSDALDIHRASGVQLETQLSGCKKSLGAAKASRAETSDKANKLAVELSTCEGSVSDLKKAHRLASQRLAEFRRFAKRFQRMIATGKLDVVYRRGQMVVKLPAAILFPSGSADLSAGGKKALSEVADILKQLPHRRFMVAGHTDNVPVHNGQFNNNWELSTARAVAVTKLLISRGVNPRHLVAAGYGQYAPIASNRTKRGRGRNRRIEIILEPNLHRLPKIRTKRRN